MAQRFDLESLRQRLAQLKAGSRSEWDARAPGEHLPAPAEDEHRPAAVLIPLYEEHDEWHLLLTQRTDTVSTHKGQVAFPGGRADPEDADAVATALREAHEEIGLPPNRVEVLGRLDDLITVTRYRVTPIVARIPWPVRLTPSPYELSAVFGVPVRWLADPANRVVEHREPPVPGPRLEVIHWPYAGFDIWGASARMILNLLEIWSINGTAPEP
ncbi:MAG TPA: CoA pyrophosphatase [Anaerolineales bacterium]|nr:CoA pyrophosphatase [Anaerolineales bacterium]